MLKRIFKALFGTKQERDINSLRPKVDTIGRLEQKVSLYRDEEFKERTLFFQEKIRSGELKIFDVLPEAFAMVREAAVRVLKMRHYDVQIMGGLVLESGKIAEMKTGEGKTLTATLAVYTRALEKKGAHLVTVNDYLAKRDSNDLRPLYEFLGLTVGCIDEHAPHSDGRRQAYDADVTFGTNNEFGFDFLRDNMVDKISQKVVQRGYNFCIIDEVDSILIDEARTPLIISGPSEGNVRLYYDIDKVIPKLKEAEVNKEGKEVPGTGDYVYERKDKNIYLTEEGAKKVEKFLGLESLFSLQSIETFHHVNQALRAHKVMEKDIDYIVENDEIVIVDEFTGRKMEGRRFSDGLHQAIEAKEGVTIQNENQTLASITFQNFFRMYKRISGMTGTADTEAHEFKKIYQLDVVSIPTNKPMIRKDMDDKIYRTKKEKYTAITERVSKAHKLGQPVLAGTLSVESSEELSVYFKKAKLPHEVLNAKNHAREAMIVEKAGQEGSITIATNMAGRGTDIKLGPGVVDVGGLLIVGSERAESRRVDNQLRGRSGRQGDPGESQFYISLEDDLMLRFGSARISNMMLRLGLKEGEEIQHRLISKSIEGAQKKVENRNFDIRKHLLEYDDVMNQQRQTIYARRNLILQMDDLQSIVDEICENAMVQNLYSLANFTEEVNEEFFIAVNMWLQQKFSIENWLGQEEFLKMTYDEIEKFYLEKIRAFILNKFANFDRGLVKDIQKSILLNVLDNKWKDHLHQMDQLREGIFLRSYAEKKPITEFKNEGYKFFEQMVDLINEESLVALMRVQFQFGEPIEMEGTFSERKMVETHGEMEPFSKGTKKIDSMLESVQSKSSQAIRKKEVGRNDPCPCGSGKKYKNCCGRL